MRLSPIDIKKQEFKKSFKGYDVSEVEAFLDTVANEMEKIFRENQSLKERIEELEKQLESSKSEIQIFRDNEKTFQKAIVKSQDMSEDLLDNAKKRAELIIKEAEILSHKTKLDAQQEMLGMKQELEDLRNKNEMIIEDIRNYLVEKLNSIEDYTKNRKILRFDSGISALKDVSTEKEDEHKNFDLNIDESN